MLSTTYLQNIAVKYQTTHLNVRREYVQHLLLSYLYQQPQSSDLYFKGGTALRLMYRSPRFSEDLDFDTPLHDHNIWEHVIENSLVSVAKESVGVDIQESKTTTGGYFGSVVISTIGDPITIHIEISFRKDRVTGELFTIENDFVPSYLLKSLRTDLLVDGKLHALFTRQKARDFYDLYFILRANMISVKQKQQLTKVIDLLSINKLNFNQELSKFLPRSQSLIVKDFKATLISEIRRNI